MLQSLRIENFAIIEAVMLDFSQGMTVLSGETGAGKSIIIDALGMLCGGRGSADYIRHGHDKLVIEGLFTFERVPNEINEAAIAFGLTLNLDEEGLIIRREIHRSGKNSIRLNGQLANVSLLKEIGTYLVDIHGQNEHQDLLDKTKHLALLDTYGWKDLQSVLEEYRIAYELYNQKRKQWLQASQNDAKDIQRQQFLEFQLDELEEVQLVEGEDEALEAMSQQLQHGQQIAHNLSAANNLIGDSEQNILDQFDNLLALLEEIRGYQPELVQVVETLESIRYDIQEVAHQLATMDTGLDSENQTLDEVENRLTQLSQLKRKFGMTISELMVYYKTISEEVYQIQHRDRYLAELKEQLISDYRSMQEKANRLNDVRQKVSEQLVMDIEAELKDLYMENSRFFVQFDHDTVDTQLEDIGIDRPIRFNTYGDRMIEFYAVTNVGETAKPIVQVASGGELSRFMLALKTVFSRRMAAKVMVFDEIDTGVSGRVGQAIAEKIREVSNSHQVLCITHLPQVAAISDEQLYIYKEVQDDTTKTQVKLLALEERSEVIAMMLSGRVMTETSLKMASELLKEYHGE